MFARRSLLQIQRMVARCEGPVGDLQRGGKCLNSVQLIGYTGGDPVRGGTETHPLTRFSLATTKYYPTRDDKIESKTSWHSITVFKPFLQDKVNSYVRKGTRLFVQGSIDYNSYVDQEGQKKYITSIIPNDIIILGRSQSNLEGEEDPDF
ncbi:single-stranded DNA-binding protein, mitochondrial-like [Actinia tenebrosa]|uniref:Single-stranded DNA-binding protein, mitochondrial-like n=1 Tax=Actinia tenebrosa TaxID=6105 RepID=A0A6P8HAI7_ACTTE|nr:single-stranded DNA-binding protein, mitochondrial-like [Actinia tenebrosa]